MLLYPALACLMMFWVTPLEIQAATEIHSKQVKVDFFSTDMKTLRLTGVNDLLKAQDVQILLDRRPAYFKVESIVNGDHDQDFITVNSIAFGYVDKTAWLRFPIKNNGLEPIEGIIHFRLPILDFVRLYESGNPNLLAISGDQVSLASKTIKSPIIGMPIHLEIGQEKIYYLQIMTTSSLDLNFGLITRDSFHVLEIFTSIAISAILGGYLIMFLYNMGLAISIRDKLYYLYSAFILLSFAREAYISGILPYCLSDSALELTDVLGRLTIPWSVLVGSYFSMLFLNLKVKSPRMGQLLWLLMTIPLGSALTIPFTGPNAIQMKIILLGIVGPSVWIFICAWFRYFDRAVEARFFAFAWSFAILGYVLNTLLLSGTLQFGRFGSFYAELGQILEIVFLSFAFGDKYNKIRKDKDQVTQEMHTQLKTFNDTLQAEVQEKTRNIKSVLDNIHQGVMPIDTAKEAQGKHFIIGIDHSAFLNSILDVDDCSNQDPIRLFFKRTDLPQDVINQIESILLCTFGEPSYQFVINEHLLPKEANLSTRFGTKYISLDWNTVVSVSDETVLRVLLVLKDQTEFRNLAAEHKIQNREMNIVSHIVKVDESKYQEFLDFVSKYLTSIRQNLNQQQLLGSSADSINRKDFGEHIFRELHSIKGLSRTFQMLEMSELTHEAENLCHLLQTKTLSTSADLENLSHAIEAIENILIEYKRINYQVLGRQVENVVRIEKIALENATESISQSLEGHGLSWNQIARATRYLKQFYLKTIEGLLEDDIKGLGQLAKSLNKEPPIFIFSSDASNFLLKWIEDSMRVIFIHILRNSIDHGIESADTRISKGKPAEGTITIRETVDQAKNLICIEVGDDGAGLSLYKIAKKAEKNSLFTAVELASMAPMEIADIIFKPGFSTAEQVTGISGRGVGLDAVRKSVLEVGGEITILLKRKSADDTYEFSFLLTFPSSNFDLQFEPQSNAEQRLSRIS